MEKPVVVGERTDVVVEAFRRLAAETLTGTGAAAITRASMLARHFSVELLETRIAPAAAILPIAQLPAGVSGEHAVVFLKSTGTDVNMPAAAPANPASIDLGSLSGGSGFTLFGATASQFLGSSVGSAGDVNGDGYDDIVATDGKRSSVVFGKAGGFPAGLTTTQLDGTNGFRVNVGQVTARHVGDFDGDGVDDLLLAEGTAAYLIRGHRGTFPAALDVAALNGVNGFRITGLMLRDYSQQQIDGAGDVNGDGYADLLLGSPSSRGGASVIFGRAGEFPASLDISTLNGATGFQFQGIQTGSFTGAHVAGLGDINGDGFGDIGIGSIGEFYNNNRGEIFVIYGHAGAFSPVLTPAALDGTAGFRIPGVANDDVADRSGAAGDVNGDGLADFVVSASYVNSRTGPGGAAYVIFGSTKPFASTFDLATLSGANGFTIPGIVHGDLLGSSVDGAGDVNGDGYADLILGASVNDGGETGAQATYIVFGKARGFPASFGLATLSGATGFTLIQAAERDFAGQSVSGAGDVNGDGFADIIVGAPENDGGGNNAGAAHIVFGHPTEIAMTVSPTAKLAPFTIAPNGRSAVYTDADGDLVTVKVTAGRLGPQDFVLQKSGFGARLTLLNLGDDGREFAKTNIVITAVPQRIGGVLHGDGSADVDAIDATGVRLGRVVVSGTLGHIDAGDGRLAASALPALTVRGGITAAKLLAGSIAKATIGGSIESGGVDGAGLFSTSNLGAIFVKGSLLGDAQHRVNIAAEGIAHPTAKTSTALASLTIGGSAEFARIAVGGDFHANAGIGTVTISGLFRASDIVAGAVPGAGGYFGDANDHSPPGGSVLPLSRIASIQMRGGIAGTVESGDSFGLVAQTIARLIVGGYALRPTGNLSLAATGDVRVQLLGIG